MRALFLAPLLFLAGCSVVAQENGDYFQASASDLPRFEADDQACANAAREHVAYDLTAMGGTDYDHNRAYNAVYGPCMRARGHATRPYFQNWFTGA